MVSGDLTRRAFAHVAVTFRPSQTLVGQSTCLRGAYLPPNLTVRSNEDHVRGALADTVATDRSSHADLS